jgi:hypothetical protein
MAAKNPDRVSPAEISEAGKSAKNAGISRVWRPKAPTPEPESAGRTPAPLQSDDCIAPEPTKRCRSRKVAREARRHTVALTVTYSEEEDLRAWAERRGLTFSTWARKALLNAYEIQKRRTDNDVG